MVGRWRSRVFLTKQRISIERFGEIVSGYLLCLFLHYLFTHVLFDTETFTTHLHTYDLIYVQWSITGHSIQE